MWVYIKNLNKIYLNLWEAVKVIHNRERGESPAINAVRTLIHELLQLSHWETRKKKSKCNLTMLQKNIPEQRRWIGNKHRKCNGNNHWNQMLVLRRYVIDMDQTYPISCIGEVKLLSIPPRIIIFSQKVAQHNLGEFWNRRTNLMD